MAIRQPDISSGAYNRKHFLIDLSTPIVGDITCLRIDNSCWQASHTCLLSYQQHNPQRRRYRVSHAHIRKANRQRSVRLSVIFLFESFVVFRSSFTSFRPKYVCLRFLVTITVSIIFLPDLSTSSGFHCSNLIPLERRNNSSDMRLTAYLHGNSSFDIYQSENTKQDKKKLKRENNHQKMCEYMYEHHLTTTVQVPHQFADGFLSHQGIPTKRSCRRPAS